MQYYMRSKALKLPICWQDLLFSAHELFLNPILIVTVQSCNNCCIILKVRRGSSAITPITLSKYVVPSSKFQDCLKGNLQNGIKRLDGLQVCWLHLFDISGSKEEWVAVIAAFNLLVTEFRDVLQKYLP